MALLEGRVALITGAGNGIGRAEALLFAAQGARVVVNDFGCAREGAGADPAVAEAVVAEIVARGGEAVASGHDVRTEEGARAMVALAVERFGGLDVLVNNAAILRDRPVLRAELGDLAAVTETVLYGTFNACRAAAAVMVPRRRGGRIVNTLGAAGLHGNLGQSAYSAAAAGVYGLTRTLAAELKKHDILVNGLCPIARTRLTEDLPMFAPDGGLGDDAYGPQFVAPAALFLASALSGDLAGEVLSVAGTKLSLYRVQESHGVVGDDPRAPWQAEAIREAWDRLGRFR
jgi:NAD(P)-dependent dehydrogenase (short-subunit alcohol dehydrogenase family)